MKNKSPLTVIRNILSAVLAVAVVGGGFVAVGAGTDIHSRFDSVKKISYSTTCRRLSPRKNRKSAWRQGMVSGNGLQGVVTSGAPYSDSLIFQNMHFIMPGQHQRYTPDTSNELETVKQSIIKGEDIVDEASYDDVYYFHPGGALRIDQKKHIARHYYRFTNYETAETGVSYRDVNGDWERTTFTSQADGVNITRLNRSTKGKKLNLVLSYDPISSIANYGGGDERAIQYKNLVTDSADTLAMVAHYPDYENSELKEGGYATVTYIVLEGGSAERSAGKPIKDEQYAAADNPTVTVRDADSVTLITLTGRTDAMGPFSDFAAQDSYALVETLKATAQKTAEKYSKNGTFDYAAALKAHTDIFTPLYDAVEFTLNEEEDSSSNNRLLLRQRHKKTLKPALLEKLYYSGRYAYLCCSGYSATRLAGMWTGEFNPGWGSKYTMDANVNLQSASLNSGNLANGPIGYAYFLLRQVDDWEQNAEATHGYKNCIQAPVHADGDCAALTETCYSYPFRYWNAGASWMLEPLYETLQTYGNLQIPLSDEFDLNKLKSVLSLTEKDLTQKDVDVIESRGYLMLREDILLPLLIKSAAYWQQLVSPEYYTAADGSIHYEKGKTALKDGETYCILPSYSPENNPKNYPSPSDANCAIDIGACRSNLEMLLEVIRQSGADVDTAPYKALLAKLPPYLYDETGALKEWATTQFEENNEHRHLSHLYAAWPLDETQEDEALQKACIQAVANRESENEASHALVHRALIADRLKDRDAASAALLKLMNHRIHYNSLMTNHDYDRGSAYCTDFGIGYLGIINESLMYSDTGKIELLPCQLTSGFEKGSIRNLRARTQAAVSLAWDEDKCTAEIISDIDQTVTVSCGRTGEAQTLNLKAGNPTTVEFNLH